MPNYYKLRLPISARRYFLFVSSITVILLGAWTYSKPILVQQLKFKLGLSLSLEASPDSFYQDRVQPIFDNYCVDCHNDNKSKGKLRLDAYVFSRHTGKTGNSVIPGNPHQSGLLMRMLLADVDKKRMPPLGWDQPNANDIEVLTLWIDRGASSTQKASDFPDAPERIIDVKIPTVDISLLMSKRAEISAAVDAINSTYSYSLSYLSRNSAELHFSNVSIKQAFGDAELSVLLPVAPHLYSLYLRDTNITDASITVLSAMSNLTEIHFTDTNLTQDGTLDFIHAMPKLKRLILNASSSGDALKDYCVQNEIELTEVQHVQF